MAKKMVTLTIDGRTATVPEGTLVVDAAKKIGVDIPVFCFHPKMEPVGMCRMCLVEIGRPVVDRATGELQREPDGSLKISFGAKLETACTTPVSEHMVVVGMSDKARAGRKEILEFLLTSHPLDCPVCDKGGECPLQNLTMAFGPGQSRFIFDEKIHFAKRVPLGELIFLDRERCIQCARCVRFQRDVADDPVIGFYQRGRALEITTCSEPGFDSIFSGNTTDICPVGALTTADFRFGARPWEMKAAASICNQCPVGCNITFNVRREARAGGERVIKRVMPRQNEAVNEIWICDKGRFGHHFTESKQRLTQPLIRKHGELQPATWDEALDLVGQQMRAAGGSLVTLASGRLSNEDLFNLRQLTHAQAGQTILYGSMSGGNVVSQLGVGPGTNFGDMGKGTAILVVASDLHEEAPIWWLRVKQAAQRGATLVVVNPRPTRLDRYATFQVRYPYGQEASTMVEFLNENSSSDIRAAAGAFARAENGVILYGSEGTGLAASAALARACADLLVVTGHIGRANNGLAGVWPHGNTQGAWDMGFQPVRNLAETLRKSGFTYIAGADPVGDYSSYGQALIQSIDAGGFVLVQELFLTETARLANVVLPALPFTEREGTYTSGERRLQRFYPAAPAPLAGPRADFIITAQIGQRLGMQLEGRAASLVLLRIAQQIDDYAGMNYQKLAEVIDQWPMIGRNGVYYGGTTYDNHQGLGVQLANAAARGEALKLPDVEIPAVPTAAEGGFLVAPVTRLLDHGRLLEDADILSRRLAQRDLRMNPAMAARLQLADGEAVQVQLNDASVIVTVELDESLPDGVALAPRSTGVPVNALTPALVTRLTPETRA